MRPVVAVAGSVAQRPARGGHAWVFLQYLLGFRRLGYEVLFLDRLSPDMCESAAAWPPAGAVGWLREVMSAHDLDDRYALLLDDGSGECVGLSREAVVERLRSSVLLLDVMGFLGDEELLAASPRRVFLDIDPGFPQMWQELGLHQSFGAHDAYATVGLRVGEDGSSVPTCGIDWIRTPPPVVLDEWPATAPGKAYSSVATWRGPFGPIDFDGLRYGLRAHQMRRFAQLPRAVEVPLELALDIDDSDAGDAALLRDGGWRLVSPQTAAGTVGDYRGYVQGARGEVGVAKDMYARSRGGWLSDRSVCYLASGKPVLAQATGFERAIETGAGLISFETPEQAVAGLEQIEGDYAAHSIAARELAAERFDSDHVLTALLEAVA
jgi:hypothetical protein